jgi:hypothetical protein
LDAPTSFFVWPDEPVEPDGAVAAANGWAKLNESGAPAALPAPIEPVGISNLADPKGEIPFPWPSAVEEPEPETGSKATSGWSQLEGPAESGRAPQDSDSGWDELDQEPEKKRRRWFLLLLLIGLFLFGGWLIEQLLQPAPILSLRIATDGMIAPPQNKVFSGQTLGPQHLTITNSGTARACWWISAQSDNPALGSLISLQITNADATVLYSGPVPSSTTSLFGSVCPSAPLGSPAVAGTEAVLTPGTSAIVTISGAVGNLPSALNGQILNITWSSLGGTASQ